MFLSSVFGYKNLPLIVKAFFYFDAFLVAAYLLNYFAGQPFNIVSVLFDLDGEISFSAWFSSIQFFCISVFAAIYANKKVDASLKSWLIYGMPIVFLLMSIDESVQFHEWLGQKSDALLSGGSREGTIFQETGIWMLVIGVPFIFGVILWGFSVKDYFWDDLPSFFKMSLGMLVLLTGALGVEFFSNFTSQLHHHVIEVVIEEGLEMFGATIIFWAVYDMALRYMPSLWE